jgi:hypothetical protein
MQATRHMAHSVTTRAQHTATAWFHVACHHTPVLGLGGCAQRCHEIKVQLGESNFWSIPRLQNISYAVFESMVKKFFFVHR